MHELDCRRMLCPMPVIKTQNEIEKLQVGDQLQVICTDPGVMQDIPSWCRVHGHTVMDSHEQDDEYILTIRVENHGS